MLPALLAQIASIDPSPATQDSTSGCGPTFAVRFAAPEPFTGPAAALRVGKRGGGLRVRLLAVRF